MSNINTKTILSQLKSDKLKERQQGITSIREYFARDSVVESIDEKGDGYTWLVIFQALFSTVYIEKQAAAKKGLQNATAATLRRLEEAASTVRWLTERTVTKLNRKVTKSLIAHLCQTIVYRGQLLKPVALDYAKSLRIILTFHPHLEHLDVEQWLSTISLSFAIVLGDDLKSDIEEDPYGLSLGDGNDDESDNEGPSIGKRRRTSRSPSRKATSLTKTAKHRPASLEEIEFTALIAILLRCPGVPYLSKDRPLLARAVLSRLHHFFVVFPSDTSAHFDAILAVNIVLEQLALNATELVMEFGVKIWGCLLDLWNTKQKAMKEGLLSALIILFPFVTHKDAKDFNKADGVCRLLRLLNDEHESRWGIEPLSFDSIRLEVAPEEDRRPFVAGTFRYGFNFTSNQALAWVALELQADCISELFQLSESTHLELSGSSRAGGKRQKLENPISTLLHSIHTESNPQGRLACLQTLLFVIDRHWSTFHAELQQEIVGSLLHWLTVDHPATQSWAFLCFSAIVNSHETASATQVPWDSIWSHAMRRTNVSGVCRSACHTAYMLLVSQKLPVHRILAEVEAMAQDIDVQGPIAPYDSVCAFFSQCMKVANQDVRLHRMQLEEKVLMWLTENWNASVGSRNASENPGRSRMDQHTVDDIFSLLQTICGLTKRFDVVCKILLPDSAAVDTLADVHKYSVIREFLLHARIKHPTPRGYHSDRTAGSINSMSNSGFVQPAARERKASAFCLKILEATTSQWEPTNSVTYRPQAENLRRSFDLAVMGLLFESYLALNGIQCNKRVLTASCHLISLLLPFLKSASWSQDEQSLIFAALAPLVSTRSQEKSSISWEALASPGNQSGIKRNTPIDLAHSGEAHPQDLLLRQLQRFIWQSAEVQNIYDDINLAFQDSLELYLFSSKRSGNRMTGVDNDKDDFAVGTTQSTSDLLQSQLYQRPQQATCQIVELLVNILALSPMLRAVADGLPRDKILSELFCECDDDRFDLIGHAFLFHVEMQHVYISSAPLNKILDRFGNLLMTYAYSRSERFQLLAIQFLTSTMDTWLRQDSTRNTTRRHVRQLCRWLLNMIKEGKMRSWCSRDSLIRFLDHILELDPREEFWQENMEEDVVEENGDVCLPSAILPRCSTDDDIRVRFTSALSCARLFSTSFMQEKNPMLVYQDIKDQLSIELDRHEFIISRFLCLGNIMITSSSVRQGPYWHLLETCLHTPKFTCHIETILSSVAHQIGLPHYSELFQAYAPQIAYSIKKAGKDFFKFPPHLLGYQDRKEYALATFTTFSSTNLLLDDPEPLVRGQDLFNRHCQIVDKTTLEGLYQCFAKTTGIQIVLWIHVHYSHIYDRIAFSRDETEEMILFLYSNFSPLGDRQHFQKLLEQNVGDVVVSILRTIADLQYGEGGEISKALEIEDDSARAAKTFQSLMKYRHRDGFKLHTPNYPCYSTQTVLRSLKWLSGLAPKVNDVSTTYHILHELFGEIGKSYLVNEQLRLMQCICVWIAYHHSQFKDSILLRVLTSGAAITLAQPELSSISQGMLEWAFQHYIRDGCDNVHLPDICIKISTIAHHSLQSDLTENHHIDDRLLNWIEGQMLMMSKVDALQSRISSGVAAWPRGLSGPLEALCENLNFDDLSSILCDHNISAQKFKLVRRLSTLADQSHYSRQQYAKYDFWRLKNLIPADRLSDDELDCFINLLLLNAGMIQSCGVDSIGEQRQRSRKDMESASAIEDLYEHAKHAIMSSLMRMLTSDTSRVVYVAYRTLRKISGSTDLDTFAHRAWPREFRGEISYFSAHPISKKRKIDVELSHLLQQEYLDASSNFTVWVSKLSKLLSDVLSAQDTLFLHLSDIFDVNESFAETTLPVLIHSLLQRRSKNELITEEEEDNNSSRTIISQYLGNVLTHSSVDIRCLKSIVTVVLHLRHFKPLHLTDELAYDHWLDVDYLLLSRSAIICGAYTTALLFLELASEYRKADTAFDESASEQILFDIYSHLDEPDGFYGIKTNDLQQFLLRRFHHEQQWEKALRFHGAEFEASGNSRSGAEGILESLHSFGFNKLAITTLQSGGFTEMRSLTASNRLDYEFGWRTESWDLPELDDSENTSISIYLALRAVHRERDPLVVDEIVRLASHTEIQRLRLLGNENLVQIRRVTRNLMCIAQLRRWKQSDIQRDVESRNIRDDADHWYNFCNIHPDFDFPDLERIIATKNSLLRSVRQREQREQIGDMKTKFTVSLMQLEKNFLIQLSEAARQADQKQIALNSVLRAQQLEEKPSFPVTQEFAHVLWTQDEQKLAIQHLKALVDKDPAFSVHSQNIYDNVQKALTLVRLGEWAAEACLEKPEDIQSRHFKPAAALLNHEGSIDAGVARKRAVVFYKYAIFAEQQYHSILKSPDLLRLKIYSDVITKRLKSLKSIEIDLQNRKATHTDRYKQITQYGQKNEVALKQDSARLDVVNDSKDSYLQQALDMLSLCLEGSDEYNDDAAIRLCSLWFANFHMSVLDKLMPTVLARIASRKLVFLSRQLSARLSNASDPTSKNFTVSPNQFQLQELLVRMCTEHPFHSLYQIYFLKNSNSKFSSNHRQSRGEEAPSESQADRTAAANKILNRLNINSESFKRAQDIILLCDAYLEWAVYPIKNNPRYNDNSKAKKPFHVPSQLAIRKIADLKVPVTTAETPLDPTMNYEDCVWIQKYSSEFETAGGINLPKITTCLGSDGKLYKQLFKGEGHDDLRQDAVMEQVFEVCNQVLKRDRETRRRELSIRSYKVIPLAPQAGMLEFVGNTQPLSWLHTAHHRYYPIDLHHTACRNMISSTQDKSRGDKEALIRCFLDVRRRFRPVMRHIFTEQHKTPMRWFEMRLNYSRSVATTSIVGHILGLGDRHVSNILLDNGTGEIVHIDLGIAFDQGKELRVPERVPFRLTADMVDGFGISGTEGVFRRCAEETLRVLRDGSDVIKTILEVFKYDPLHSWTLSPKDIEQKQSGTDAPIVHDADPLGLGLGLGIDIDSLSGAEHEAADRALSAVARKLDKSLSVEYTVNELIAEATDIANLAQMYHGWGAYL